MASNDLKFKWRVETAARCISSGRTTGRTFSGCFEWMDGDAVLLALLRRAERRPGTKMASRMTEVFVDRSMREISEKYKDLPDEEIPALSQHMIDAWNVRYQRQQSESETLSQRLIDKANERWRQQNESEDTDEYIVWGIPKGETERNKEELLAEGCRDMMDVLNVIEAAGKHGYHSFRHWKFDGAPPNFAATVAV